MKLKKGQKVYYFKETGPFMGDIMTATVVGAAKDLYSRKVLYTVVPYPKQEVFTFWNKENETLYEDQLYTNLKKIQHEYKDYLAYGALVSGIGDVKEALDKLYAEIELIKKKIKK